MKDASSTPPLPPAGNLLQLFTPRLAALAARGVQRRYRAGSVLIHEGAPGGSMYFVREGLLRTYTAREEDGAEFTFGFYGPGETLGEMSLDGGLRTASVVVEEAAQCAYVDRELLRAGIAQDPDLAFELIGLLTRRARMLSNCARDLALTDVYGRLRLLLRATAQPQADGTLRMPYPLTQVQLAQQIGCTRPMVSKLLNDLNKGDYLRLDGSGKKRRLTILKALPPHY